MANCSRGVTSTTPSESYLLQRLFPLRGPDVGDHVATTRETTWHTPSLTGGRSARSESSRHVSGCMGAAWHRRSLFTESDQVVFDRSAFLRW